MPSAEEVVENVHQHVHQHVHAVNPFMSRTSYPRRSLIAYRILTPISLLLALITSIYFTFAKPHSGKFSRHTIWGQNHHRRTPFRINSITVSIYWIFLYLFQAIYCWTLWSPHSHILTHSANLASHFIFHNLLLFGFINLWCRSYFWSGELLIILNFANLGIAYIRFPFKKGESRIITHTAVLAGPLSWTFVALFWDGAAMMHATGFGARLFANVMVWTWFLWGAFFLSAYKDYATGFSMSILSAALGVSQFIHHIIALQWIFAFTIMAVLFLASAGVAGWDLRAMGRKIVDPEAQSSGETAPLLRDGGAEA
ncbi:MAG: hypothetical protein M1820_002748 [Bogoriella megaspora]|nr:MAG: hypothetical protein M1820_002748 [Bogoriella megaspora]